MRLIINPRIGGSIVSLMIKDEAQQWAPVVRTMPVESHSASDAGSFVMLPWTNRIKDARFSFDGHEHTLESNAADQTAIHGIGRALPWRITDRSPITARLALDSRAFDHEAINYPFAFGAVQRFEISPDSVDVDLSITNLDDRPIPVGCGHHPYFHRHLFSKDDDLRVRLDVSGRYPADGCIPTGEALDDLVCRSLRSGEPIANPGLDDVFSGFGGAAELCWPTSNVCMTMRCSSNLDHLVIYTPRVADGEADEYVCIEPTTMVNDGFNQAQTMEKTGVTILEPNETLRTRMTLTFGTCEQQ